MHRAIKAIIFDMDGVLVDSEPLWRRAMIKGFTEAGISFTEEDCRKTTGLRLFEVVEIWVKHYHITKFTVAELEARIIDLLIDLIEKEAKSIPGITEILTFCKEMNLKTGLATSSSNRLMNLVLKKLNLTSFFDAAVSAENMKYGKPHPEVFISCAQMLYVNPAECLVIEDSVNGVISGKAAQMKVIAVPDLEHQHKKEFAAANYFAKDMGEALSTIKGLFLK